MPDYFIFLIIILFICGIGVGFVAALLGLGGGFANVPIFMFLCFFDIHVAVSASLLVILFTSLSATINYIRQKRILFKAALYLEGATIVGGILSSILKTFIQSLILAYIFSTALLIMGIVIIYTTQRGQNSNQEADIPMPGGKSSFYIFKGTYLDNEGKTNHYQFNVFYIMPLTFIAGFIAGLIGIGGGAVKVPVMIGVCGIPIHLATSTSSFMIVITSLFSTITNLLTFQIPFIAIIFSIFLGAGEIVGAQIGARFSTRVPATKLKLIFGGALVLIACYYFFYTTVFLA